MLNQSVINPITKKVILIENEPQRYVRNVTITHITPKTSRKNDVKLLLSYYLYKKSTNENGTMVHEWGLTDSEKFTNSVNYYYQKHSITKT